MPKRWERELRRLGDVPAPAERIRARSARATGSQESMPMPSTGQRVVAGAVAFGVFLAAAAFGWLAFRTDASTVDEIDPDDRRLVITLEAAPDDADPSRFMRGGVDPAMRLTLGERTLEGFMTGYSWCAATGECSSATTDYDLPTFWHVPVGTEIVMNGDATELEGELHRWQERDRGSSLAEGVPLEPGQYELQVDATFPQGEVTFVAGIQAGGDLIDSLTDTDWRLTSLSGSSLPGVMKHGGASIGFGQGEVSVWSGCTSMVAGYRADQRAFASSIADPELPQPCRGESDLFAVLASADRWSSDGATLSIDGLDGSLAARRVGVEPVDVLRIECLPGRTQVLDPTIVATHRRVRVVTSADRVARIIARPDSSEVTGWVLSPDDAANGTRVKMLPGSYSVRCEGGDDGPATPVQIIRDQGIAAGEPASEALRLRCDGERTTVLTPIVEAREDGVHVIVLPSGEVYPVEFMDGESVSFGGDIEADGESHPWPVAPGLAEVACGAGAETFDGAQPFEVVDPDGHWARGELSCSETSRDEVVGYDGGGAEWVSEEAMIRGILHGVRETDRIIRALYGRDRLLRWVIVRGRAEVGVLSLTGVTDATDPRGTGLGRVDGEVCSSTDIDGTVHPRDPDGDGVTLECMASNQVAFRHRGPYLLPLGESAVRANVPGIRDTDVLVPPEDGSGVGGYEGIWRVEREGKTVASIVYPTFDGITCRWNAIGVGPNER